MSIEVLAVFFRYRNTQPICFLLYKFMKKILLVSVTGMGDSLWGTPGIRALKKAFPAVKIDLLVNRPWKSLFEHNPRLNKIFEYQSQWYLQPFAGIQLFKRSYDVIFIFHANHNFRRMLPWFRSFPVWCHQNLDWIPESHRVRIDNAAHGIRRREIMLEKFNVKPDGSQMEIFFDRVTIDSAHNFLHAHDFSPEKYVYLNLGAAVESRRWMVDRFIELASQILNTTPWNIILGGGPNEKKRAMIILNKLNTLRAIEVCSQPILVNAEIISKARLMVTADTGPMHIAFALKTRVVALFGTISPTGSGVYEVPSHLCKVVTIDPENQNSVNAESPGEFYFRSIRVERVWKQVEKMLAERSNN
jgi:ADP-heptose:LPS heptosyltransferase